MKNYFDLTGQTAVVTGASTGLGVQMAKAFLSILPLCTVLWEIWRQHVFLVMLQKAALSI